MKTIFTSDVVGHRDIKEFQPQPAKNFMPDWYKKMPSDVQYDTDYKKIPNFRTAKLCPNFSDIFTEGFVLPAPCDIWLSVPGDKVDDWMWKTSNSAFGLEMHGQGQLHNYLPNPVDKSFETLENYKIKTNKVSANFLLLDFDYCKYSAIRIKKLLEKKGILLRSLEAYKLKNKLRLTIGNTKENILLLKTLEKILKND